MPRAKENFGQCFTYILNSNHMCVSVNNYPTLNKQVASLVFDASSSLVNPIHDDYLIVSVTDPDIFLSRNKTFMSRTVHSISYKEDHGGRGALSVLKEYETHKQGYVMLDEKNYISYDQRCILYHNVDTAEECVVTSQDGDEIENAWLFHGVIIDGVFIALDFLENTIRHKIGYIDGMPCLMGHALMNEEFCCAEMTQGSQKIICKRDGKYYSFQSCDSKAYAPLPYEMPEILPSVQYVRIGHYLFFVRRHNVVSCYDTRDGSSYDVLNRYPLLHFACFNGKLFFLQDEVYHLLSDMITLQSCAFSIQSSATIAEVGKTGLFSLSHHKVIHDFFNHQVVMEDPRFFERIYIEDSGWSLLSSNIQPSNDVFQGSIRYQRRAKGFLDLVLKLNPGISETVRERCMLNGNRLWVVERSGIVLHILHHSGVVQKTVTLNMDIDCIVEVNPYCIDEVVVGLHFDFAEEESLYFLRYNEKEGQIESVQLDGSPLSESLFIGVSALISNRVFYVPNTGNVISNEFPFSKDSTVLLHSLDPYVVLAASKKVNDYCVDVIKIVFNDMFTSFDTANECIDLREFYETARFVSFTHGT
ncbi:hypothetical protein PCE1_002716 [Barthelona sp. PCE]